MLSKGCYDWTSGSVTGVIDGGASCFVAQAGLTSDSCRAPSLSTVFHLFCAGTVMRI